MRAKVFWAVLGVALAQALLGGIVVITRSEMPQEIAADEVAGDSPTPSGDPAQATGESVGTEAAGSVPIPGAVPVKDPPPGTGNAAPAESLKIASSYGALRPDEMYPMDPAEPGDETVIEGRRDDGAKWRMYARRQASGDVCVRSFAWSVESGRGGGGGHGGDCPAPAEWGFTLSSDNDVYIGAVGFAPGAAAEIALVAKDGRVGKVPGVHRPDMGVSFFLAYVECAGPDWERLEARDESGAVLSSYSFDYLDVGTPSWSCEQAAKSGQ